MAPDPDLIAELVAALTELHAAVERFRWSLEGRDLDGVKLGLIAAEEALLRAREEARTDG